MKRKVIYLPGALKDLERVGKNDADRILTKMDEIAGREGVIGKLLRNLPDDLKGLRSYRVGDNRVIFRLSEREIKIYAIGHRSEIYKALRRR
jgi:mRNA-degrading endonuclease RelE of RelBE toxin-antitoxin system